MTLVAITRAIPTKDDLPPTIPSARVKMSPAVPQLTRSQLLDFVRGADAVISMFHDRIDDELLDAAGPQLRGVCNFAVGIDNFDLAACRRRGILVANTPDAVTEGTANIALGLMLAAGRHICAGDRFVRSGRFQSEGNIFPTGWLGVHFTNQAILIVGAGRIGRAVALRAQSLGMRVLYTARTRHLDFEQAPLAATRVDLDQGLALADVVSLHTPLTAETRHLMDARRLGLMKPTAILVNTARGPVIDEQALVDALVGHRIYAAGVDVFEQEPKVHPGLMSLDNVVMTPHIGSGERYWREQMTRMVCENAEAMLTGRTPPNLVN